MRTIIISVLVITLLLVTRGTLKAEEVEFQRFIIDKDESRFESIEKLKDQNLIKNTFTFNVLSFFRNGLKGIPSGAYKIEKGMNAWQIAKVFSSPAYMRWVTIKPGVRKEQVAEILSNELHWDETKKTEFLNAHETLGKEYLEGVYLPDTHLLPVDENGLEIAKRIIDKFNEKFNPYYEAFLKDNTKPFTALKIASLVEREAAGKEDMPLIAGIIWNRLLLGMKLDIDATLQYAKGKVGDTWWGRVTPEDKKMFSPFNTYRYKGLPPTPIANPGLDAIDAVLNPEKTNCFYYLHDGNGKIYCSDTYAKHKENIEKYLKT